jgi:membrane protease YdiL (CAAX protease family)
MSLMCTETAVHPVAASKPRVWTVFIVLVAGWVLGTFGQIMVLAIWGIVRGVSLGIHGVPPEEMGQVVKDETVAMLANPLAVVAFLYVPFQLGLGLTALVAGWLSPERLRARLGLIRPALPAWGFPMVAVGSLAPLAVGLAVASLLLPLAPPLSSAGQTSLATSLALVFFFSVVPPFVEELFFRGYVQRRLLQRWPPVVAILVTAALFAVSHGNLALMTITFLMGIWLGVLAWRTGSVWPSMVCHAFWNATVQLWGLGNRFDVLSPTLALAVGAAAVGLGLGCFVLSVWVLARRREAVLPITTEEPMRTAA